MKQVHTEDPQTVGVTVQNLVVWATWHLEFGYPWIFLINDQHDAQFFSMCLFLFLTL